MLVRNFKSVIIENYANFEGRARRSEYWYFYLAYVMLTFLILAIDAIIPSPINLTFLYILGMFIPVLAITVRRLHDCDKSGWLLLVSLIPLIGSIILFVFLIMDGTSGPNQYGSDPKAVSNDITDHLV